ncbi:phage neck terminator protein [Paracandidimonas lactea]|uniref:phage neck terminator protein n=1 Tax=Paracandidimonas lactea TaxID=2895524 RepID=UPI001F1B34BE|nr:hypothetical protein [Paracandidimonas lactea]
MSIDLTFFQFFESLLTVPLVQLPDNGPRAAPVFATIQVTPGTPLPVHKGDVGADGLRTLYAYRTVQIQIQCYGPGAWDVLDTLAMALATDAATTDAEARNIGILSVDLLQSVPALMDNQAFEDRAILDITANYVGSLVEDVGYIETVIGSVQVDELPSQPFEATLIV